MRFLLLLTLLAGCLAAQTPVAGRNSVVVRGQPQDVYFFPADKGPGRAAGLVLYLPGDGGWRGFAVDMVKAMASYGYDVYAWDTKQYLTGFTSPKSTLKESDVMGDARTIARWMTQGRNEKVTVSGWSEGAGLALLAAATPEGKSAWRGLVAIGLPDYGFLGWRLADNMTYLTKKDPVEPRFDALAHVPKVAPLPTAMIFSNRDEYVPPAKARQLFDAATEPKRIFQVDARDHRFDGNQAEFFKVLREALGWVHTPR